MSLLPLYDRLTTLATELDDLGFGDQGDEVREALDRLWLKLTPEEHAEVDGRPGESLVRDRR